jgi:glycosyltransferase involved in cell wall biosynthesis
MRILQVAEAFGGGVFEMIKSLAEGIASEGHDVAIAYGVRPETPEDVRAAIDPAVELFTTPWQSRTAMAEARGILHLRRLVREWEPDLVHLHSSFAGLAGALAVPSRIPTIYSPHGYSFTIASSAARQRVYRGVERFVAQRVSLIGAVSAAEAHQARDVVGARDVITVPNGIPELDQPGVTPLRAGRPRVLALGRIAAQRQPEACARILGGLHDVADVEWVGGAPSHASHGSLALKEAAVPVTGWLPRHSAQTRLSAATAYLHWTAWDGQPLSVLEALAKDVVVVASDIPANREILGEDQVFAHEDDATTFLRRVIAEPDLAESLRSHQRQRRERYTARRMVADWMSSYDAVVADAHRSISGPLRPITSVVSHLDAEPEAGTL